MRLFAVIASLVFTALLFANDSQDSGKKVLGPADAFKAAKEAEVTVKMTVKSVGISMTKEHWWLNSEADHKAPKNFSVFVPKSVVEAFAKTKITDPKTKFDGKTVQVTGFLHVHHKVPAITLGDVKNIKIVE
jgi:hypothetical protein